MTFDIVLFGLLRVYHSQCHKHSRSSCMVMVCLYPDRGGNSCGSPASVVVLKASTWWQWVPIELANWCNALGLKSQIVAMELT